ncbi:unnamed protein product [[Actinomadura] parvosata subsp. kistnae]|uniref:GAF domain-containing protein n=1 Tax=[Actinomadura] parvosata subsp. kistnae TaxID=1909395 RepID=A0A1U9ZZ39_9ACTN|nr:hypothetical protein BKM31_18525 [Nonomuraea sp. ATCC 55076]SPL98850.1 unnamed protein product [Actinomadura parvosata subsp. kistnae]
MMRPQPSTEGLRQLIDAISACHSRRLFEQIVTVAAEICGTGYAGLVEAGAPPQFAQLIQMTMPPGDPLRVRRWLGSGNVLLALAGQSEPIHVDMGRFRLLSVPVPLNTRSHAAIWVAGSDLDEHAEEYLIRFATAAGRVLEAHRDLEEAGRMLRAVQAFSLAG